MEFGKTKASRLITRRAEQPKRIRCAIPATSASPHNSISSSELLRFCSYSSNSCATLKSKRRKGMAQIRGEARRPFVFDLHSYTIG